MIVETDIPFRLDRLPWLRFHTLVVLALGITWLLDGLEVTVVGAVSGALQASPQLHLTDAQIGSAASAYLAGAVLGALLFGWLADRLGRKRLFFVTLGVYALATVATAFSSDYATFALCRFVTGAGIGGEYAAINSAIQELIPARYRGRTDLAINGSFWLGAVLGSLVAAILLEPGRVPEDSGWRLAFALGGLLALVVLLFRRHVPESPRWLLIHGQVEEAQAVVAKIEQHAAGVPPYATAAVPSGGATTPPRLRLNLARPAKGFVDLAASLLRHYPRRAALGLVLMSAQAFFYNAIFFTFALVLGRFFAVRTEDAGLYLLPFAITNFLGPLALGWLFDHWGRRPMITATYAVSGIFLGCIALMFVGGMLSAATLTVGFAVVFFFASAAASSAYLTVSECFPLEVRALAIAMFYALGTALGGVAAPWIFGSLIGTGDAAAVAWGYGFAAALMIAAALTELWLGIAAERRALEDLAAPLSRMQE